MKFLADEGVDAQIVKYLREQKHDVAYVAELNAGIKDSEVLSLATREKRILVTCDKDFGDLVYRLKQIHTGIVLLRIMGLSLSDKIELVSLLIQNHGDQLANHFTVVNSTAIRIRKLSIL